MNTKERGGLKTLDQGDLERWLNESERRYGVLIKVEVAEGGTVATLNRDVGAPASKVKVKLDPERAVECDVGTTRVCEGEAYISSTIMKILVCR